MTRGEREQSFIARAKEIHKDENLDFSKVDYYNNRTPVVIIDPIYGEFLITPSNLLKGKSHPVRRGEKISQAKRMKQDEVIRRFQEVHKHENMDYSQVVYRGMHVKVKIICHDLRPDGTEYGEFWQEPAVHLKGCTHPDKGRYMQAMKQLKSREDFIRMAMKIHPEYCYDKVVYRGRRVKVEVICPIHGSFFITPDNLLQGKGCKRCGNRLSVAQDEIINHLKSVLPDEEIMENDLTVLEGHELDIYIPSRQFAIEYNGLRWHSEEFGKGEDYHIGKTIKCHEKGIRLAHVAEDVYKTNKAAIFSRLEALLAVGDKSLHIDRENAYISEINAATCKEYTEQTCIITRPLSGLHIACKNKKTDVINGVMTFQNEDTEGAWTFVSYYDGETYDVEAAKLILDYFIENYRPKCVLASIDRQWFSEDDGFMSDLGFSFNGFTPPSYTYTDGHSKRITIDQYNQLSDEDKSRYHRMWDCGQVNFILTP